MPFWRVFLATRTNCILLQGPVDISLCKAHHDELDHTRETTPQPITKDQRAILRYQYPLYGTRLTSDNPPPSSLHLAVKPTLSTFTYHPTKTTTTPSVPKVQKLLPPFPTRVEVFLVHLFSKTKSFPAIKKLFGSIITGVF